MLLHSPLGQYACKDGKNSPCLVYVSFNHKIYVYWRVELERMEPTNLLSVLEERPEYPDLLHRLGVGEWTSVCVCEIVCRAQHCSHDHLEELGKNRMHKRNQASEYIYNCANLKL